MKKLQRTLLLIEDDPEERAAIRRALEAEVSRDITARKRAEEALREQARLMALREDIRAAQGAAETLPALLQAATEALVKHLGVAFARIWTLNEAENVLELQASAGLYTHLNGPHGRVIELK